MDSTQTINKDHLKHMVLDDQNFSTLIQSNLSDIDIIYLSFNNSLTTKQINILFEKNIVNANINLLRNPHCPLKKLEKFVKLNDKIYNIAIASNTALSIKVFNSLLAYEDFDVDIAIAFNPNTPKEVLKILQAKENEQINFALSQNNAI